MKYRVARRRGIFSPETLLFACFFGAAGLVIGLGLALDAAVPGQD